jgi:hypothetical protein
MVYVRLAAKADSNSTKKIRKHEPVSISIEIIQHSVLHERRINRWKDPFVTGVNRLRLLKNSNGRTKVQCILSFNMISAASVFAQPRSNKI